MYTQLLSIVKERREMQIYVVFSTTFTLNYNDINEREDHNSNSHNDTETKKNRLNRSSKTGFFGRVVISCVISGYTIDVSW